MSALPAQTALQNGAFIIQSTIGRGGLGITYRARDVEGNCDVALKECFPAGCKREGLNVSSDDFWSHRNCAALQNRFRTQAAQLERISHPHLARVFDCFEENGTVYLRMELVEGPNLLQVLEAGEVSIEQAQGWMKKIAGALGALHDGGLLHLDVKPENIILRAPDRDEIGADSTKNEAKVANAEANSTKNEAKRFGNAEDAPNSTKNEEAIVLDGENETNSTTVEANARESALNRVDSTKNEDDSSIATADSTKNEGEDPFGEPILLDFDLVQPQHDDLITRPLSLSMQCGTPGYAPLEQYAQSGKLTPATDFYALGATWYHLVTARAPLGAIDRALGTHFAAPLELRAEISPAQSAAILRALHPQSEERPQNAAEFLELLRPETPDLAALDYDAPAPLDAQFLKHGTGIHRVVLTGKTPVLPSRCVCCHQKADATWLLISPSGRFEMPCCQTCQKHQLMSRAASFVTFWGSLISLAMALLVALISVVTSTLFLLFISALCIVLNFAALSYGALKSSRAEEMLKNSCCDLSEPATYIFNGRVHIWKFKNGEFAADFKKRNAGSVV